MCFHYTVMYCVLHAFFSSMNALDSDIYIFRKAITWFLAHEAHQHCFHFCDGKRVILSSLEDVSGDLEQYITLEGVVSHFNDGDAAVTRLRRGADERLDDNDSCRIIRMD